VCHLLHITPPPARAPPLGLATHHLSNCSTPRSPHHCTATSPGQLAARRKKIHTLGEHLPPADIEPTHLRKMCTLCHHQFPASALRSTVAIQTLKTLRDKLEIDANFAFDEEHALSRYYRVPVCAFCSQVTVKAAAPGTCTRQNAATYRPTHHRPSRP
jgi:hypothetical protein